MKAKNKINFTHKALKNLPLPADGKRGVHFDTNVPNLCLIVTDKGGKAFYVRKVIGGQSKRIRLGAFPDLSVENARTKAMEIKTAIAQGEDPHEVEQRKKAEPNLKAFFDIYYDRHSLPHKKPLSQRSDRYLFSQYIQDKFGTKKLSTFNRNDISKFHEFIGSNHGHYSANRVLALLRNMFNKSIEWGYMQNENPAVFVKAYREESRDRFLSDKEIPRFFQALEEEPNKDMRDYFLLSLFTGARKHNLLSMQWEELDFSREIWRIADTKNHTPQDVYLCPEAMAILEERLEKKKTSPYVFPSKGKTGHLVEPKSAWKRILERAGIENLRIHDLRRTLGSYQAISGSSMQIIGKSLGHKTQSATQVYSRLSNDPVKESVNRAVGAMLEFGEA